MPETMLLVRLHIAVSAPRHDVLLCGQPFAFDEQSKCFSSPLHPLLPPLPGGSLQCGADMFCTSIGSTVFKTTSLVVSEVSAAMAHTTTTAAADVEACPIIKRQRREPIRSSFERLSAVRFTIASSCIGATREAAAAAASTAIARLLITVK
ncbi:hypothetical protein MAPG_04348 [Magnaporthiopsis poae ATCC 64411]|uniref:Uncharacterized protein n=1 Tax=Magnaporthiopsis poae (strain ATCC 64411 / 73-15) TaxID=644358 RepID=A0A0C4DWG8_MAGP6|nr:hypothetical protein MAPG_04348 [Magnaporthiopsis poae ATCC 64411]